jgi:hypothetical protein
VHSAPRTTRPWGGGDGQNRPCAPAAAAAWLAASISARASHGAQRMASATTASKLARARRTAASSVLPCLVRHRLCSLSAVAKHCSRSRKSHGRCWPARLAASGNRSLRTCLCCGHGMACAARGATARWQRQLWRAQPPLVHHKHNTHATCSTHQPAGQGFMRPVSGSRPAVSPHARKVPCHCSPAAARRTR